MYRKTTLSNNVTIVTDSIPYFSTVSLGLWWKTGGRYEHEKNNGISHFIEHMLFKGTRHRSAYDIAREIDAIGGTLNAFTSKEYSCLYARVLHKDIDVALDIIADMYKNPLFLSEDVEKEKFVIAQEIKMVEDNPEEHIYEMFNASYFKGHSLGLFTLGTNENIKSFSRDTLLSHFKEYYAPHTAIITATGRVDHEVFVKKIETLFGDCEGHGYTITSIKKPVPSHEINIYEKDLEHVYLCIGTDGVSQIDNRRYSLYLLNAIMGGSMSSHLFQEIREKRGLVYNVYSYVNCYHDIGTFGISTSTSHEFTETVLSLIKEEILRIRNEGITDGELTFSKKHIKGNLFISLESSESRMGRLAKNEIYFGGYIPIKETLRQIDSIKKTQVNELAQEIFQKPEDVSLTILGHVDKDSVIRLWKS